MIISAGIDLTYSINCLSKRIMWHPVIELTSISCCCFQLFSCVQLFVTSWSVAHQASLSRGFPRQEYWSGLPFPSPGDLPDPEIEFASSPVTGKFFTTESPGKLFCFQFWISSVTQLCLTLCDPMDSSTSGFAIHHRLPELLKLMSISQWCHPTILSLPSPSSPAFNLSQHWGLLKWVISSHQVAKVLKFQL